MIQDRHELAQIAQRRRLLHVAMSLQWLTIAWMMGEAGLAIWVAVGAHSISLLGFGFDSLAELISAGVVAYRLNVELHRGSEFNETIERRAALSAGALLFAVAAYVAVASSLALIHRSGEVFTIWGFGITAVAFVFMVWLGRRKRGLAAELGSAALRADSAEAIACAYLSLTVLVGFFAQYLFDWWWIDAAVSLGVLYFLIREGSEAVSSHACGD